MMNTKTVLVSVLLVGLAACGDSDSEPRGVEGIPTLGAQIDRSGRPAISTALQATFDPDTDTKNTAKDAYNTALPAAWAGFATGFSTSLAVLDSLDGTCGNQLAFNNMGMAYGFLAATLADDQLYINSAVMGNGGTYLGVEANALGAIANGDPLTGGGRGPDEDIIDRSYSVLAAGILNGVDDTIAMDPDGVASRTAFPFLIAPTL